MVRWSYLVPKGSTLVQVTWRFLFTTGGTALGFSRFLAFPWLPHCSCCCFCCCCWGCFPAETPFLFDGFLLLVAGFALPWCPLAIPLPLALPLPPPRPLPRGATFPPLLGFFFSVVISSRDLWRRDDTSAISSIDNIVVILVAKPISPMHKTDHQSVMCRHCLRLLTSANHTLSYFPFSVSPALSRTKQTPSSETHSLANVHGQRVSEHEMHHTSCHFVLFIAGRGHNGKPEPWMVLAPNPS